MTTLIQTLTLAYTLPTFNLTQADPHDEQNIYLLLSYRSWMNYSCHRHWIYTCTVIYNV